MTISEYTIKDEKGNNVTVSKSSNDASFRLVHDATKVLMLEQCTGYTETKHSLFLAGTFEECVAEANRIGLEGVDEIVNDSLVKQVEEAYSTVGRKTVDPIEYAIQVMTPLLKEGTTAAQVAASVQTVATKLQAEIKPELIVKP